MFKFGGKWWNQLGEIIIKICMYSKTLGLREFYLKGKGTFGRHSRPLVHEMCS